MIKERTFTFGDGAAMVAITSEASVDPALPAVLLLNAGIVHRIGPARNTVEVARALAAEGFLAMRFDLSGIGDSEARSDTLSIEDRAALDLRQAMDHLERTRGVSRFVLFGLCSGADNGFRAAKEDPRVVGAVLVDGYGYRTPRWYLHYYGRRALALGTYRRLARRVVKRLAERRPRPEVEPTAVAPVPQWERVFPPREAFAADVRALARRNVKLLFVYTGGVERYYNHERQLHDAVPGAAFDVRYFGDADHTITELETKARLRITTVQWLMRSFPPALPRLAASS